MVGLLLRELLLVIGLGVGWPAADAGVDADYAAPREAMIRQIELEVRGSAPLLGLDAIDRRILDAMRAVPRHLFVPATIRDRAYLPWPVPIHPEQNLTAPVLTALMLELARIGPEDRVFETGTDTGYQGAVLSRLARQVYSIEIVPELAAIARRLLEQQKAGNVQLRTGDGYQGWPEVAQFDVILVKEAVDHLPPPLLEQLAPGGRLVLPLGPLQGVQRLTVVTKRADGSLEVRRLLPVRFSPFQRGDRT